VGIVEDPTDLQSTTIVMRTAPPRDDQQDPRATQKWLVATPSPLTWAQVEQLNTHGVVAVSRYVLAHPPSAAERYPEFHGPGGSALGAAVLVGGLALLEVVLLAGPAFAVGARRRRRELAFIIDPTQVGAVTGLAAHDADRAAAVLRGGAVLVALNRGYADLWPAPTPYPIAVPWLNVGIAVLVVPLVAMLGAGLLTRSRLPIERRL